MTCPHKGSLFKSDSGKFLLCFELQIYVPFFVLKVTSCNFDSNQSIKEKIEALDELPPTEGTLKRRISEARQKKPDMHRYYWSLGMQTSNDYSIPPEAVKHVLAVHKKIKETLNLSEYPKIPIAVVHRMATLYTVISDPLQLFLTAWAYTLYETVGNIADSVPAPVDTSKLDNYLLDEDYGALAGIATGLYTIVIVNKEDISENLTAPSWLVIKGGEIMPGNQIVINTAIKYYVGDSKMEELLTWLDSNGIEKGTETDAQNKSTKIAKARNIHNGA